MNELWKAPETKAENRIISMFRQQVLRLAGTLRQGERAQRWVRATNGVDYFQMQRPEV